MCGIGCGAWGRGEECRGVQGQELEDVRGRGRAGVGSAMGGGMASRLLLTVAEVSQKGTGKERAEAAALYMREMRRMLVPLLQLWGESGPDNSSGRGGPRPTEVCWQATAMLIVGC